MSHKASFSNAVDIYSFGLLMNYVFTQTAHDYDHTDGTIELTENSPYFSDLI